MKKKDFILIGVILILTVLLFVWSGLQKADESGTVVVSRNGKEYGRYALGTDQTVRIGNTNVLVIKNGKASMEEASCPDQICVRQMEIQRDGQTIVCLPNRVVVEIEADDTGGEIDAMAD